MRLGPQRLTRDIRIVQQLLVDSERAIWLGDGHPKGPPRPLDDMPRAVARVRALFPRQDPGREIPEHEVAGRAGARDPVAAAR